MDAEHGMREGKPSSSIGGTADGLRMKDAKGSDDGDREASGGTDGV
jgi:hypothetical protein